MEASRMAAEETHARIEQIVNTQIYCTGRLTNLNSEAHT